MRGLITKIGYTEAMPVVVDPGVLKPEEFIGAVLERRLPKSIYAMMHLRELQRIHHKNCLYDLERQLRDILSED